MVFASPWRTAFAIPKWAVLAGRSTIWFGCWPYCVCTCICLCVVWRRGVFGTAAGKRAKHCMARRGAPLLSIGWGLWVKMCGAVSTTDVAVVPCELVCVHMVCACRRTLAKKHELSYECLSKTRGNAISIVQQRPTSTSGEGALEHNTGGRPHRGRHYARQPRPGAVEMGTGLILGRFASETFFFVARNFSVEVWG